MEQEYKTPELKAWEKAASGHFFDDIDTCLQKLINPHPDELAKFYEDDRRAIDPLSPVISDDSDEDEDDAQTGDNDNHEHDREAEMKYILEQYKQFDYIHEQISEYSLGDIDDICLSKTPNAPQPCADDYARFYELNTNRLRNTKCLSTKKYEAIVAKRLFTLLYELDNNHSNQLMSLLAFYLKHKFSTYVFN